MVTVNDIKVNQWWVSEQKGSFVYSLIMAINPPYVEVLTGVRPRRSRILIRRLLKHYRFDGDRE